MTKETIRLVVKFVVFTIPVWLLLYGFFTAAVKLQDFYNWTFSFLIAAGSVYLLLTREKDPYYWDD
jgi:hypothetical protein